MELRRNGQAADVGPKNGNHVISTQMHPAALDGVWRVSFVAYVKDVMLRRPIVIAAVVVVIAAVAAPAYAGRHPLINVTSNNNGVVGTAVVAPGHGGSRSTATVSDTSGGSGCTWVSSPSVFGALPHTVHEGKGNWWGQFCPGRGLVGVPIFVPAGARGTARLTVTPGALAQRAANELRLPTPMVDRIPSNQALVNLPEWFWIPRSQWRPLTSALLPVGFGPS